MKIVLNRKYGKFSLSDRALQMLSDLKGIPKNKLDMNRVRRTDKFLIQVVSELGSDSGMRKDQIRIHKIPDGIKWIMREYDGIEWVEWPTYGGGVRASHMIPGNE